MKTLAVRYFYFSLTFMVFILNVCTSSAQGTSDSTWHFLAEPYILFPYLNGEIGVRQLPAVETDAIPSDIFSKLKFGGMLYLEATNKNWAASSDLLYVNLIKETRSNTLIKSGDVSVKQLIWELAGLRRVTQWLEVGLAGRLVSLKNGVDVVKTVGNQPEASGSVTKTWFDPLIIVRSQGVIHEKWILQFRGDFGGFGVGSDFTWQAQANVAYKFSKLFQAAIGYKAISIHYDKGAGADHFLYNMVTFGPVLRFGFNF